MHNTQKESRRDYIRAYQSRPERKAIVAAKTQEILNDVLDHYGAVCACCGEKERIFLTLDHVAGGGNEWRRSVRAHERSGRGLYRWIQNHNYPSLFRVLCMNCNQSRGYYGYCPHECERGECEHPPDFDCEKAVRQFSKFETFTKMVREGREAYELGRKYRT